MQFYIHESVESGDGACIIGPPLITTSQRRIHIHTTYMHARPYSTYETHGSIVLYQMALSITLHIILYTASGRFQCTVFLRVQYNTGSLARRPQYFVFTFYTSTSPACHLELYSTFTAWIFSGFLRHSFYFVASSKEGGGGGGGSTAPYS
jgi:hypothetical protein